MEEEQRLPEKTIPVFTVLKNGAILKNIFVVNSRDFSSPERNGSIVSDDDDEVEEILVVGRHPDCDILLTHPSISRFHLEIRSISSLQKLFVTDLSSGINRLRIQTKFLLSAIRLLVLCHWISILCVFWLLIGFVFRFSAWDLG